MLRLYHCRRSISQLSKVVHFALGASSTASARGSRPPEQSGVGMAINAGPRASGYTGASASADDSILTTDLAGDNRRNPVARGATACTAEVPGGDVTHSTQAARSLFRRQKLVRPAFTPWCVTLSAFAPVCA